MDHSQAGHAGSGLDSHAGGRGGRDDAATALSKQPAGLSCASCSAARGMRARYVPDCCSQRDMSRASRASEPTGLASRRSPSTCTRVCASRFVAQARRPAPVREHACAYMCVHVHTCASVGVHYLLITTPVHPADSIIVIIIEATTLAASPVLQSCSYNVHMCVCVFSRLWSYMPAVHHQDATWHSRW